MAETPEAQPSFELISGLLAQTSKDRLVCLKHKLNCTHQDTRSCKLLQAMILLTLSREAEAREVLKALGDDVVAAHICRSRWGSTKGSRVQPLQEEVLVAQAVARVYSLLVDENLCGSQARDEAYRAAIEAFRTSEGGQSAKLNAFLDEAWQKCGPGFVPQPASSGFNTLKSDPEKFPRSVPISINGSLAASVQPLRSTGTPLSFVSHFEMSQSPTVPYLTQTARRPSNSAPGPSRQPAERSASPASPPVSWPRSPGVQDQPDSVGRFQGHHFSPPDGSVQGLVAGAELPKITGPQDLREGLPAGLQDAPMLQTDPATKRCIRTPSEDSCSPPQNTSPKLASSSTNAPPGTTASSSSREPYGDESQFFMFVVVHANGDELIACRVKERLESLGVSDGATFCEDFLVPGHNQLACFQDALDNSAFTLLLLTEKFMNQLGAFQTNMALMYSFTHIVRSNSVIPFVPKESPLKNRELPSVLAGIVSLDENLCIFEKRVKNTFRQVDFQRKKASWSIRQHIRHQERLQEQQQDYLQMQQRLSALLLQSGHPHQMPFPRSESCPGLHHVPPSPHAPPPFSLPTFSTPGMFQPPCGPGQASLFPPFTDPLPASGPQRPQPHLIIQNAQMVQIGDYNQMQVERTNVALGAAEDERAESPGMAAGASNGCGD